MKRGVERIPEKEEHELYIKEGILEMPRGEKLSFKSLKLFKTHVSAQVCIYGQSFVGVQLQEVFNLRYNEAQKIIGLEYDRLWGPFEYNESKNRNVKIVLPVDFSNHGFVKRVVKEFCVAKPLLKYQNIQLSSADYNCIKPGKELNDNVVDFYMAYLSKRYEAKRGSSHQNDVYLYNSHFYAVLRKDDVRVGCRVPTLTVNVFSKSFLFVPIVQKHHWALAICCYPRLVPLVDRERKTCILYCDSLRRFEDAFLIFRRLRQYLNVRRQVVQSLSGGNENSAKMKKCVEFNEKTMPGYFCELDVQNNSWDCGMYLLSFVDHFMRNPPKQFPVKKKIVSPNQIIANRYLIMSIIRELAGKNFRDPDEEEVQEVAFGVNGGNRNSSKRSFGKGSSSSDVIVLD